ncbi:DUF1844 domain-containing protein [candidate division NPL-UPA2 bacterium]|nr:DUF1844 domain-containing protein [candidate division NPL-UPA2 bacterium]
METKKKVDEAWKARVEKEKSEEKSPEVPGEEKEAPSGKQAGSGEPLPEPDFSTFISGLGMQALLLLGELSDPQAKEKVNPDYQQARYIIDLIDMLRKKTEGKLTPEEANLMENLLYDLRMRYLKHV